MSVQPCFSSCELLRWRSKIELNSRIQQAGLYMNNFTQYCSSFRRQAKQLLADGSLNVIAVLQKSFQGGRYIATHGCAMLF
jgi:hypothetical protein